MPKYQNIPQFEHGLPESTGVLVVNLGTPDAPTTAAVRRFLRQFLSDPRVVEYPRLLWWLILNLIILVIRPSRSAAAYQKVWTDKGSPLMTHSMAITDKLRTELAASSAAPVSVELAMTYGEPSIDSAIDKLLASGARRIVTLPLYPQYSGTTTASVFNGVVRKLAKLRWIPEARFINNYHDEAGYIDALAASIRESWEANGRGDKLLMSFHGVPKSTLINGDPYHCHCQAPYTDETIKELGHQGLSRIDVVCPGFSADCLETLEEIAMQNAEFFIEAGGGSLHYIPALNSRDDHVRFLAGLLRKHTMGWEPVVDASSLHETRQRARELGAES
jgi:ferrochelatase